ncbi:MAG: histidinol phosphatase [Actinobacteria bacterium]|nr:histidinol phosphatase [Actinomycetota bacterium]
MKDLDFALRLADAADEISLARFRALDLNIETKPDRTPVTDADRAVESKLRDLISQHRPQESVIGEEFANSGSSDRVWIIDPIDGTANYLRGVPVWASLIALRVNGEIVTSVVSAPALGRRWWATKNEGAFTKEVDGSVRQIQVSKIADLEHASISFNSIRQWDNAGLLESLIELTRKVWRDRAYGDFLSYMYLAEGVLDMVSEHGLQLYDIAALVPIVEEAGGRLTALQGPLTEATSSVLATNGLIHEQIQRELGVF